MQTFILLALAVFGLFLIGGLLRGSVEDRHMRRYYRRTGRKGGGW
jgi:hypothetical protein